MERFGQLLQVACRPELGNITDPVHMIWVTVWCPRAIVVLLTGLTQMAVKPIDWM